MCFRSSTSRQSEESKNDATECGGWFQFQFREWEMRLGFLSMISIMRVRSFQVRVNAVGTSHNSASMRASHLEWATRLYANRRKTPTACTMENSHVMHSQKNILNMRQEWDHGPFLQTRHECSDGYRNDVPPSRSFLQSGGNSFNAHTRSVSSSAGVGFALGAHHGSLEHRHKSCM
jgi:hypothetical protein